MTFDVVTLFEDDDVPAVRTKLAQQRFHHLPAADGQHELVRALTEQP